ncbi:hypothetical protein ABK040_001476 [Willaertia magna]
MKLKFFDEGLTGPNVKIFSDETEGVITWKEENKEFNSGHSLALSQTGITSGKMSCTLQFVSLCKNFRTWFGVHSKKHPFFINTDNHIIAMIGGKQDCCFKQVYLGKRSDNIFGNHRLMPGESLDMVLDMDLKKITFKYKKNGVDCVHEISNLPNEKLHLALGVSSGAHVVVTNYKFEP